MDLAVCLEFYPGFRNLVYLFFGQDLRKSKMFRIKEVEDRLKYSARNQERIIRDAHIMYTHDPAAQDYGSLALYNLETSGAVLTGRNELEIFTDGRKNLRISGRSLGEPGAISISSITSLRMMRCSIPSSPSCGKRQGRAWR